MISGHGREFRGRRPGRRFGFLSAGIRVDLGIHDQDIDIAIAGEDMVQPAEADIVCPAVTADDPDQALEQIVAQRIQVLRCGTR